MSLNGEGEKENVMLVHIYSWWHDFEPSTALNRTNQHLNLPWAKSELIQTVSNNIHILNDKPMYMFVVGWADKKCSVRLCNVNARNRGKEVDRTPNTAVDEYMAAFN